MIGEMKLEQMQFDSAIKVIVTALEKAGFDPYSQLTGYIQTGQDVYITRESGARDLIAQLDVEQIKAFLETYKG